MKIFERKFLSILIFVPIISYANGGYFKSESKLTVFTPTIQIQEDQGYLIKDSNIVFDCKGKILDGKGKIPSGIAIESYGKNISNITIKNCTFQNYGHGIRIGWGEKDILKEKNKNIYSKHPNHILIENVKIINSLTSGIYIDDHVSYIKIINSEIKNSKTVGIYLEHSSKNNTIINSRFSSNGFKEGRIAREAIAIDSSFNNLIKNNIFQNNAKGSVFLYKNCQENVSSGESVIRENGANNNTIIDNKFINENIGVWLASRQSKNLASMNCGDNPIFENKYYKDYANKNLVKNNIFCNVKKSIIIEGDSNKIQNNLFYGHSNQTILLPITPREKYLNQPQIGNNLIENKVLSTYPKQCNIK